MMSHLFIGILVLSLSVSGEPESEGAAEFEWEGGSGAAEPGLEGEPEAEGRADPAEIIVPPLLMMLIIVVGLSVLALKGRKLLLCLCGSNPANLCTPSAAAGALAPAPASDNDTTNEVVDLDTDELLSAFDLEVLQGVRSFNNRAAELLRISLPAFITLALSPLALYVHGTLTEVLWPADQGFKGMPNVNDAISCFLAPAGLVYATSFGFAFQQALNKQGDVLNKVTYELGLLDQILTLTPKLSLPLLDRLRIYRALKAETIFMALQIEMREPHQFKNKPQEDVKVKLWDIMDILRNIDPSHDSQSTYDLDRMFADRIINHMLELNSICSDRMGTLHARIHPLKWAFLECLGFFSFFGILLCQADSYRVDLLMCNVTVFSISLLCYVVSDLDSPFSGFFRIDVSVIDDLILRLNTMFKLAKQGKNELVRYPDRFEDVAQ